MNSALTHHPSHSYTFTLLHLHTPTEEEPTTTASSQRKQTKPSITVGGMAIAPGKRQRVDIPVARLPTQLPMSLPVTVVNGKHNGPTLWLSAAIHGDEINGVEIIRRVLATLSPRTLKGSLIAVPVVNIFGFIGQSRYLPDRRDLNRSFPGSSRGSLASILANLFMSEVVANCTHGIDLHTAAIHRCNLPQIRANLDDAETRACAEAFGAPLMIHAATRDGSLRQAAAQRGIPVLLYEAGEALRFDTQSIDTGVSGIRRVMSHLDMIALDDDYPPTTLSSEVRTTKWLRASRGGLLHLDVTL
ncbi:MAG: succinylglutamate desuccinylase/aspartoacylase family protein, partial [Leptolyngbyaceae bacterium]|nr:succinylglutamate desuccinylase/aspartoacylase family protein [Leptolyngbyaceae bacterium]